MTNTIKSVCEAFTHKLCNVPYQDFGLAAAIRDVHREADPKGEKVLTQGQVKAVEAFFQVLIDTTQK